MKTLPERLRDKSNMMKMGERVAWGSDTAVALLGEAADLIDLLQADNLGWFEANKKMQAERDEYRKAADDQAMAHKVEREK